MEFPPKGIDMKRISSVIFLLILVLFLLIGCNNSSSDWVKYKTDNDGNVSYYKKVNISQDGDNYIVKGWKKQVYSDKGREKEIQSRIKDGLSTEGWDKLRDYKSLNETDCKKRMTNTLYVSYFDTDDKELYSQKFDKEEWIYVTPDSKGETVMKEICK